MIVRTSAWLFAGALALAFSGCSSSSSPPDFGSPDSGGGAGGGGAGGGGGNHSGGGGGGAGGGGGGSGGGGSSAVDGGTYVEAGRDAPVGTYDFGCGSVTNPCNLNQVCCSTPGTTTTFACVDPSTCPADDKISCDGPDECYGTSTPICCGLASTSTQGGQCTNTALGTSCTTASNCPTHIATGCDDTTRVTLCHVQKDCTDPNNPVCCTFQSNGASLTFCIDQTTANLGGATCH